MLKLMSDIYAERNCDVTKKFKSKSVFLCVVLNSLLNKLMLKTKHDVIDREQLLAN